MYNTAPRRTKVRNELMIIAILVIVTIAIIVLFNWKKTEGTTDIVKALDADSMVHNVTSTAPRCDNGTFTVSLTSKGDQSVRLRQVDSSALLSTGDLDKLITALEGETIVINGPELEFGQHAEFQVDTVNGLLSPADATLLSVEVTRSGDCPH